jgi:hypothetical protein
VSFLFNDERFLFHGGDLIPKSLLRRRRDFGVFFHGDDLIPKSLLRRRRDFGIFYLLK